MRALATVFLGMLASTAYAEPPGLTPLAEPAQIDTTEELPSYRLQTALADVAAVGLGIMASKTSAAAPVMIGSYLLAAPIVHLANHHTGRAGASLALRVGLPLAGLLIGSAIGRSQCDAYCDNDSDIALAGLGLLTGVVAASAIDIGYLSRGETVTRSSTSFGPTLGTGPNNSVRLGVGGTF
jgi:hypothetical protein